MPTGIIINAMAIAVGGVLGAVLSNRIEDKTKDVLNLLFGLCAMGIGVRSLSTMENMAPCIFAVIVGTLLGLKIHLQQLFVAGGKMMQKGIGHFVNSNSGTMTETDFSENLLTIMVLFCFSSSGFYGSIVSGMGDQSIMLAKAVLDLFTAVIFGCSMGLVVSVFAVPQFCLFMILFCLAKVIYPVTTVVMLNDFKAVGGFLLIATAMRMLKVKDFPVADMVPAMIIVMPLSWLWVVCILPML